MSIPANPAATGIQSWAWKHPAHRCDRRNHQTGCQARDASRNRDAAVGPGWNAFPSRDQSRVCSAILPDFAGYGVRRGFGQSGHRRDHPNPISGGAENNRTGGSHCEIGQDLPRIPSFPAFGEPERQLAAVSQAGGYPSHHKQRCQRGESDWAGAGKKQETGKTARHSPGSIDGVQGASQHREAQRHGRGDGQSFRG